MKWQCYLNTNMGWQLVTETNKKEAKRPRKTNKQEDKK